MHRNPKKLALSLTTIRELSREILDGPAGGQTKGTCSDYCSDMYSLCPDCGFDTTPRKGCASG